jgi:hypothetical protein
MSVASCPSSRPCTGNASRGRCASTLMLPMDDRSLERVGISRSRRTGQADYRANEIWIAEDTPTA